MGPPSTSHFMVLADTPSGLARVDPPRVHQHTIAKPINAVQPLQPVQSQQQATQVHTAVPAAAAAVPAPAAPPAAVVPTSSGKI